MRSRVQDDEERELARKFWEALQLKRWQLVMLSLIQLSYGLMLLTPLNATPSVGLAVVVFVGLFALFMFTPKCLAAVWSTFAKLRRPWWDWGFHMRLSLRESELIRERWGAIFQWLYVLSPAVLLGGFIVFMVRISVAFLTH